ncbi:hypothetical protein BJX99DRAFT_221171 [Aspergillus californicus]
MHYYYWRKSTNNYWAPYPSCPSALSACPPCWFNKTQRPEIETACHYRAWPSV